MTILYKGNKYFYPIKNFLKFNTNHMNYKNLSMYFVLIFAILFVSSCNKDTPKTDTGKDNQTTTKDTVKPKVNTDEIVIKIQKYRADYESKLEK